MTAIVCGDYEPVAAEYYDQERHPTCANFNELSARYVTAVLARYVGDELVRIVEVGAGRSVVADFLYATDRPLSRLALVDNSSSMLRHSQQWSRLGATLLDADARCTGLPGGTFDLVVASLGDPYNGPDFWQEAARLLRRGGLVIHTAPAPEWAARFRDAETRDRSEFIINGRKLCLPSHIPEWPQQKDWLDVNMFKIIDRHEFFAEDLKGPHSAKLDVFPSSAGGPIIVGFVVRHG